MQPNDTTEDIYLETQEDETVEETEETTEETTTDETEEDESQEDSEPTAEQLLKAKDAEIAKLRRILKKKGGAQQTKPTEQSQTPTSTDTVEETVLKAQGMAPELLNELKVIAKMRKVNLIDAQNDKLFKAVKAEYEKNEKIKKSSLGASQGSGQRQAKKSITTPGLSRDEHRELWEESQNRRG